MRRNPAVPLVLGLALAVVPSLGPVLVEAGLAAPPEAVAQPAPEGRQGAIILRGARPPSALERARFEHWLRAWRQEGAPLERSLDDALSSLATPADRDLRDRCLEIAGNLLELDRSRVLPAPDRAADLHLRRALRHLARAAVTCLTRRPYAARHALRQAAEAFGEAARVLERYRRAPAERPASSASP